MNIFEKTLDNFENKATWTKGKTFTQVTRMHRPLACIIAMTSIEELINQLGDVYLPVNIFRGLPENERYRFAAIINKLIIEQYPDFVNEEISRYNKLDKRQNSMSLASLMVTFNDSRFVNRAIIQRLLEKGSAMYLEKYGAE